MKTRTLLLLSVGTALMILLAGGALLFQLSNQPEVAAPTELGVTARVGDVDVTVFGADVVDGIVHVDVRMGGVDDADGVDSFRLVTGDQRLTPILTPTAGRCSAIDVAPTRCTVDFDISASEGSSRVVVVRRGEDQATWRLV